MFLWGGDEENKKMAWIKWESVLTPMKNGGLGICRLKTFNQAVMQKWRYLLKNNYYAVWVRLIKSIHGVDAGLDDYRIRWVWSIGSINQFDESDFLPNLPCIIRWEREIRLDFRKMHGWGIKFYKFDLIDCFVLKRSIVK